MLYSIKNVPMWSGTIDDKPGGLAEKLAPLASAGAELQFVLARRDKPGTGLVFLTPLKGSAPLREAHNARLTKARDLFALRIEGPDKKGLGATITQALAEIGVNLRGLSATAVGRKSVCYLAFDSKKDADKAHRALYKALQ